MSFGSILIGIAAAGMVLAYVVHPFRKVNVDFDKTIEAWVGSVQINDSPATGTTATRVSTPAPTPPTPLAAAASGAVTTETPINFCPNCGHRVQPDHRFCPGCGNRLRE